MKQLFTVIISLYSTLLFSQNVTVDYAAWNPSNPPCKLFVTATNVPATIGSSTGTISHLSEVGQTSYSTSDLSLQLPCVTNNGPGGMTYLGTRFGLSNTFKAGYTYEVYVTIACDSKANGNPAPYLRLDLKSGLSGGSTGCNGAETIDASTSGNLVLFSVTDDQFAETPHLVFQPTSNFSALEIAAIPVLNMAGTKTLRIKKIRIVETAPAISFTLSPATLSIPAGTTVSQTFTVNNVANTPGVTGYTWNLGAQPNGWLYNGAAAPATIGTTTNTLALQSDKCAGTVSNITAVAAIGATNYTTNACAVTVTGSFPSYSISGPALICNSSVYSVPNLPAGASLTWSIPSNAGAVLQLQQNTPAPNLLQISNMKWYQVNTTLSATTTGTACPISITPKPIANDNDNSTYPSLSYYQGACNNTPATSGTYSLATYVQQGCTVFVNLGNMLGKTVTYGTSYPIQWGVGYTNIYGDNTLSFTLPYGSGGVPFTFYINKDGGCTQQQLLFFSTNGVGQSFTAGPSPANDILTVNTITNKSSSQNLNKSIEPKDGTFIMNVYDANTNTLQQTQKSIKGNLQHKINTSRLKHGYYVLQIIDANTKQAIQSIKFFKE